MLINIFDLDLDLAVIKRETPRCFISADVLQWEKNREEQRRTDQEIQLKPGMSKQNVLIFTQARFRFNKFLKILQLVPK